MDKKAHNMFCLLALLAVVSFGVGCSGGTVTGSGADIVVIESETQFEEQVLKVKKPVLVDFWATWCPPCRKMNPIVAEAAGLYSNVLIVTKMDVDDHQALAEQFHIRAIPTFVLFYDGQVVGALEGAVHKKVFYRWLEDALKELGVDTVKTTAKRDSHAS